MGMSETKFTNAIEARAYLDQVYRQIKDLPFNADIRRLWDNCSKQVEVLSTMEVSARRTGKDHKVREYLADMHKNIENVEKWVIMLKLMA
jgi:hypothetical protein